MVAGGGRLIATGGRLVASERGLRPDARSRLAVTAALGPSPPAAGIAVSILGLVPASAGGGLIVVGGMLIAVGGELILLRRRLVSIGRGLIEIGSRLVAIRDRLIVLRERLIIQSSGLERSQRPAQARFVGHERRSVGFGRTTDPPRARPPLQGFSADVSRS